MRRTWNLMALASAAAVIWIGPSYAQQPPAVPPPTAAQMQVNVMKARVASDKDDLARSQGMVVASTALLAADEAALAKLEATPAAAAVPDPNYSHAFTVAPNHLMVGSPPAAGAKR